ncbi:lysostaphin resistance A-like protein [Flavitalea sp.]|nr:CPBP family intramembrane glutamic endopeptidase [Flavitalea sp.]
MNTRNITPNFPIWLKVSCYFLIIIAAAYIASIYPMLDSLFYYFAIAMLLSYIMLRQERKSLFSLGFKPENTKDWKHFFSGIGIGFLALSLTAGITILLNKGSLQFSGKVDVVYIQVLILIHFWSSFVQEFTYRGYPFQSMLKVYGPWTAQLVIIVPFAIMHLKLNTHITLNQFLMTLLTTGLGSILYGLCYIKTGKLLLSIGVHMGWNVAQALIPRSPEQNKTALFNLIQDPDSYKPINVLIPYLVVAVVMIVTVSSWKPHVNKIKY